MAAHYLTDYSSNPKSPKEEEVEAEVTSLNLVACYCSRECCVEDH